MTVETRKTWALELVHSFGDETRSRSVLVLADDEAEARDAARYYRKSYETVGSVTPGEEDRGAVAADTAAGGRSVTGDAPRASVEQPQRLWQMTRLGAGDYLLPSNDRETLWRIYSYEEDGTLEQQCGDRTRVVRGTFWSIARCTTPLQSIAPHLLGTRGSLLDWENWETVAGLLDTRQDAICEALRLESGAR